MEIKQKIFVIPYIDQKLTFWEEVSELYSESIKEVYFPIENANIGTGRPKQPDKYLSEFLKSGIFPVTALINPILLSRPAEDIADGICDKINYYLDNFNLTGITITSLTLAQIIKNKFPDLKITASTLMEIYNEQQLAMIGNVFDTLVPSNRVIRDIEALKTIRQNFRGQIRIMVNESCVPYCIYRTQHFYEMSNPSIVYPGSLCNDLLKKKPWLRLTGSWILPQHLDFFDGLYDEIKLSGRVSLQQSENYIKVLGSYIDRKMLYPHEIGGGPASVNIPIKIEREFYRYTLYCKKNCTTCTVCSEYWKQRVNHE
jgi:hypothetical protein